MGDHEHIDALMGEALVRARTEDVAESKARAALASSGPADAMPALEPPVPERGAHAAVAQRRPAPPSERADQAVAAPAPLARGELVQPDRKKVEINVPAEPEAAEQDGPRGPEDVVLSEPFQKLPEARSRHAKTDLRMRPPPGALGVGSGVVLSEAEAQAIAQAKAVTAARAAGSSAAGDRTVGGRTARLGMAPTEPMAAADALGSSHGSADHALAASVLSRTLGGRTERRLPQVGDPATSGAQPSGSETLAAPTLGASEHAAAVASSSAVHADPAGGGLGATSPSEPPAPSAADEPGASSETADTGLSGGEASPWRAEGEVELSEDVLPSSLLVTPAAGGATSDAPSVRPSSDAPPSAHVAAQQALARRNRWLVVGLGAVLALGVVALAVMGIQSDVEEEAIDVATGRDSAVAEAPGRSADPGRSAEETSPEPASPDRVHGEGAAVGQSEQPTDSAESEVDAGSQAAARPVESKGGNTTRPSKPPAAPPSQSSKPSAPVPAPASTGSPGLFFEKGG